ncbi:hypothetical protein NO098_350075 [Flavobacterium psychrophilum]|nr:hypothetical protein NO098_350075 [Flavobacterium psychrophilum]
MQQAQAFGKIGVLGLMESWFCIWDDLANPKIGLNLVPTTQSARTLPNQITYRNFAKPHKQICLKTAYKV